MSKLFATCRIGLVVTLISIGYLSTVQIDHPLVESLNDKVNHIVAFYILSFFADFSFPRWTFSWAKAIPIFAYGALIEIVQFYLPYRTSSFLDLAANGIGILLFVLAIPWLRKIHLLHGRWPDR
ncbi:MAG: VanZ family protein [Gammaproteobacteria bacterium]|nr:VanZ family protein [Gammaproteobacteria bacterium]